MREICLTKHGRIEKLRGGSMVNEQVYVNLYQVIIIYHHASYHYYITKCVKSSLCSHIFFYIIFMFILIDVIF